jgi:chromosome segregation ATPase
LLVVVAIGAGAGWYVQHERMNGLQAQLQETEEWARQSKLALARFEGDLSETGESLQERGSSLQERIDAQSERLESVDSEIRKLWAVANERNKDRLDEHQQRISGLDQAVAESGQALVDLEATLSQLRSSVQGDVRQLDQRLADAVSELQQVDQQNGAQLQTLQEQVAGFGEQVSSRLERFQREQKLTLDGMDSRIAALEKQVDAMADNGQVRNLERELGELKETVESIDASRSQLTSRLVRLSEEVNQLRSQ